MGGREPCRFPAIHISVVPSGAAPHRAAGNAGVKSLFSHDDVKGISKIVHTTVPKKVMPVKSIRIPARNP